VAERWQTSEGRVAAVFFRDSNGAPVTALTPTATSNYKDGTAGAPAATVAEVANGFYRITFAAAPTKDVLVRVDGGATLTTTRYAALEVPVGGYVDNVDAQISTLTGRLTATRAALLDNLSNLDALVSSRATHAEATSDTPGTTTLLARLTALRAGYLDALTLLDVAVSSRIAANDMHVEIT
jgi:hypothetical protein